MTVLLIAVSCMLVSGYLTARFRDPSSRLHILDHPNERSLHVCPTPRTGGVAIVVAMAAGGLVLVAMQSDAGASAPIAVGALAIALTSFFDDRWGLAVRWRLLVQGLVAIAFAVSAFRINVLSLPGIEASVAPWLAIAATVVLIVWMTNLYNFMDGMDGFAGGMAVIGFGAFALLGARADSDLFSGLNIVIAASALGFLPFNFPPARIFMGDTGSTTLGFLAATMMLWAERDGIFPLWIGLLIFSPFIVDATVTLLRRLARRERIWQAHKTHYYQRLVQVGWGHRKTVLWEYALMAVCGATAMLVMYLGPQVQCAVMIGWALIYPVLMLGIGKLEDRHRRTHAA